MIERLDMDEKYNSTEASIHMARYEFARQYCKGKKVLDISCGEGYGSYLLSKWGSKEVVGIDISEFAIKKANKNFQNDNLKYVLQDATNLKDFSDNYFDMVVSFETFEHINDCYDYLCEIKRVSKNNAIIIVSCPNDYYYYPSDNESNPFHIKKYKFEDFKKTAENVLGSNAKYLAGMELMGHSNIILDNTKSKKNKDMINEEKDINCIKIHSDESHDYSKCNYYIGIWNTEKIAENAVIFPHMYTDWKEAFDILNKDVEEYKKTVERLKHVNKILLSENEEIKKFSSITYEENKQIKEELYWINQSRSYKLARKISKMVKKK